MYEKSCFQSFHLILTRIRVPSELNLTALMFLLAFGLVIRAVLTRQPREALYIFIFPSIAPEQNL